VITQAINSKEFNDVHRQHDKGSLNLQALPVMMLYPPIPNSDASDLSIIVGFLKTKLFMDIPFLASSMKARVRNKSDFSLSFNEVHLYLEARAVASQENAAI
jgi:hypothetical protein